MRAWGRSTGPTACALAGRRCSLWGWRKDAPGGVPCTVVRGVCGQALPLPELPAHWAGRWGPPPTCCGRGRVGLGAQHCPLGLHALWGLRAAGWWGAVPMGGGLPPLCGASGVGRCPSPSCPPSRAGGRGSATRVSRARSVQAWGPSTGPTACAFAGRRCSLWGWRKGVPGGGAFHHCEGRLRSGAVPPPTARPLGGLLVSATHVLWARMCGCGGSTLSPWPACPVGAVCRGSGRGPSPGGVACHRCEGRLVSGAVPPPAACPLERAAWAPRPVCPECGRCGRGDPAPAPQRAPLRAGVARCEGGGRASPGGVPSAVVRGVCGQALPLPRLPALWVCCWGPPATCCGCGCLGVEAEHSPLGLHALWGLRAAGVVGGRPRGGLPATVVRGHWCQALSLPQPRACMPCGGCVPWGWWGAVPGGVACHRCEGRLVSGAVLLPAARPLGRAAGVLRPLCPGCGRCGRGDPPLAP